MTNRRWKYQIIPGALSHSFRMSKYISTMWFKKLNFLGASCLKCCSFWGLVCFAPQSVPCYNSLFVITKLGWYTMTWTLQRYANLKVKLFYNLNCKMHKHFPFLQIVWQILDNVFRLLIGWESEALCILYKREWGNIT